MRAVFLETSTSEVKKYGDGFRSLGLDAVSIQYDAAATTDGSIYEKVAAEKPQLIVYIGGLFGRQPSTEILSRMNSGIAPTVHICSDAADSPWWPKLQEYHYAGAFSLQVAIDGSRKWPLAASQMTALTPVDPASFAHGARPHSERTVFCGFAGNTGGGPASLRTQLLIALLEKRLIDCRVRSPLPFTYDGYCDYLSKCRVSLNISYSGTETAKQVKGRVLESALAGACLLETGGSPTSDWFQPGVDYIEYNDAGHAEQIMVRLKNEPEEVEAMGQRLRARVLAEHSLLAFWTRIAQRVGVPLV